MDMVNLVVLVADNRFDGTGNAGTGTAGQGNAGGEGHGSTGGGGGGAGQAGIQMLLEEDQQSGGNGLQYSLTGKYYAGGGAGSGSNVNDAGRLGGQGGGNMVLELPSW